MKLIIDLCPRHQQICSGLQQQFWIKRHMYIYNDRHLNVLISIKGILGQNCFFNMYQHTICLNCFHGRHRTSIYRNARTARVNCWAVCWLLARNSTREAGEQSSRLDILRSKIKILARSSLFKVLVLINYVSVNVQRRLAYHACVHPRNWVF